MFSAILTLALAVAAIAVPTSQLSPLPPTTPSGQVTISSITYGGTGCPQGSVGSYISTDKQTYYISNWWTWRDTDHCPTASPWYSITTLPRSGLALMSPRAAKTARSTSVCHIPPAFNTVYSIRYTVAILVLILVSRLGKKLRSTSLAVSLKPLPPKLSTKTFYRIRPEHHRNKFQRSQEWRLFDHWLTPTYLRRMVPMRFFLSPQHQFSGPSFYEQHYCYRPDHGWFCWWKNHISVWVQLADLLVGV